ncbi:MAG: bifunctional nicotinamidase/pyrazinamidase [Candidatus Lokiarchaeota archaeon]|nr:bifunctional nicotinamidase/pyrazinamidase [Candidatus Lokiarchaeota archaeon]
MSIEKPYYQKKIDLSYQDALIIVDMQNDFMPGGALPVEEGDQIIDNINRIAEIFKENNGLVVLTQDWHPENHMSFASSHPDKDPGDEFHSEGIGPILWPDHCVQDSNGANFHDKLKVKLAHAIIRKGYNPSVDSYSGFIENDKKSETGLAGFLKSLNIKRIFICGLALDYCCYFTALDGLDFGFEVYFLVNLTRGIDLPPGNITKSLQQMRDKGIKFATKDNLI